MKFIIIMTIIVAGIVLFLQSCVSTKRTLLYSQDCDNNKLELINKETIKYSYSSNVYEYWWNKKLMGSVSKSAPNMLFNSDQTYGKGNWYRFGENVNPALYVTKENITQSEFDAAAACIKSNMERIEEAIKKVAKLNAFQLGGMVYGTYDDFIERYRNGNRMIWIYPGGLISIQTIKNKNNYKFGSADELGLSNKVDHSTKTIYIDTTRITLDELREFRNVKTDRPLEVDYELVAE